MFNLMSNIKCHWYTVEHGPDQLSHIDGGIDPPPSNPDSVLMTAGLLCSLARCVFSEELMVCYELQLS